MVQVEQSGERISKHVGGGIKADTVLLPIGFRLRLIPLEPLLRHMHNYTYCREGKREPCGESAKRKG